MSNNEGIQPQLIFGDYLFEALGFDAFSSNNFIANQLVSTNVIKLQLEDSIFIHSNLVSNGTDNILQEIFSADAGDFSNIIFTTPDFEAYSKQITYNTSNVYNFYITDEEQRPINFNGLNVNFTIVLYKKENVMEMLRNFMKLKLLEN